MSITLVMPCYNEEQRLPGAELARFVRENEDMRLLLVNDGSRDGTLATLQALSREWPGRIDVLDLQPNRGKAEAVRLGMLAALQNTTEGPVEFVGYWDADLATPFAEVANLRKAQQDHPQLQLVMGVRIKLLGWGVERQLYRHYVGRIFATCAAWALGEEIYDTQCGAKLFRARPELVQLLEQPMFSRWLVDVELLFRLRNAWLKEGGRELRQIVYEQPLHVWKEVGESKVKPMDLLRSLYHLWKLRRRYRA